MKQLTWWLRVAGVFYLLLGISNLIYEIIDPHFVAEGMVPAGYALDGVTVTALVHTFLPASLGFAVLGVLMLYYSRLPEQARLLVLVVALLELLTWVPYDVVWFATGLPVAPAIPFMLAHLLLGATGILFLRQYTKKTA